MMNRYDSIYEYGHTAMLIREDGDWIRYSDVNQVKADAIREMLSDKSLYVPDSNGDMSLLVNIRVDRYADKLER